MQAEQTSVSKKQVESQPQEEFNRNNPNIELRHSRQFYVLVLGQHNIRFLRGTRNTIEQIEVEGAPSDMCEALGEQRSDGETQAFSLELGNHDEQCAAALSSIWQRNRILRYSRMVNWAIHRFLVDNQAPLIVAGSEFQRAIYHKVNTYPHLLDQDIVRNVEHLADEDLQRLAWVIVKSLFRQPREQTPDRFLQQSASGKPSMQSRLEASHSWRTEPAFVAAQIRHISMVSPKSARLQEAHDQYLPKADLVSNSPAKMAFTTGSMYIVPSPVLADLPIVPIIPTAS